MELIIGNKYKFKFAGEIILGKLFSIVTEEDKELYWFKDNKYKYPIRKENICGNLKQ